MSQPLLLYGLLPIVDYSFEAADLSAWDDTDSEDPDMELDTDIFHSAGSGRPSFQSVRMNVAARTGTAKCVLRQRFAAGELIQALARTGAELAVAGHFHPADDRANTAAALKVRFYDATGTATPGSGLEIASPEFRTFVTGLGPWFLYVFASKVPSSVAWVDVSCEYLASSMGSVLSNVYWDRIFCGGMVDFKRGFRTFRLNADNGFRSHLGDGTSESLRVKRPMTEIEIGVVNVFENRLDADYQAIQAFDQFQNTGAGKSAVWGDRELFTNAERHFQYCVVDPKVKIDYPAGIARRNYTWKLIADSEGAA